MPARPTAIARPGSMNGSRSRPVPASRSTPRIASIAKPATSRIRTATSPGFRRRAAAARITRRCDHDCVSRRPAESRPAGHDTATLKAFSGQAGREAGRCGDQAASCQSIRHPVSLRFNAKRGIVACLDAGDAGLGFASETILEITGARQTLMFSIRFNRWTIAALAFAALALPGSLSAQTPDHPAGNFGPIPDQERPEVADHVGQLSGRPSRQRGARRLFGRGVLPLGAAQRSRRTTNCSIAPSSPRWPMATSTRRSSSPTAS